MCKLSWRYMNLATLCGAITCVEIFLIIQVFGSAHVLTHVRLTNLMDFLITRGFAHVLLEFDLLILMGLDPQSAIHPRCKFSSNECFRHAASASYYKEAARRRDIVVSGSHVSWCPTSM